MIDKGKAKGTVGQAGGPPGRDAVLARVKAVGAARSLPGGKVEVNLGMALQGGVSKAALLALGFSERQLDDAAGKLPKGNLPNTMFKKSAFQPKVQRPPARGLPPPPAPPPPLPQRDPFRRRSRRGM